MIQLKTLLAGAVAFVAVHFALVATWQTWFHGGGGQTAWFLNSGQAVAFTVAVFAIVGFLVAVLRSDGRLETAFVSALNIAIGAAVPMIVTLFRLPGGPGTLFPIAIVIGFLVLIVGGAIGTCLGLGTRTALSH